MSNVLNEMQQLRLMLTKETNFDLTKAEKLYNFIIGNQQKVSDKPIVNTDKPDGIYFILSPSNAIHESLATDEDKHKSIAVGIKMGDKFANVALHDAAGGEYIGLCTEDKISCGSEQFFHDTFWKAMSDWNGEANTNDIRGSLNPDINLGENEYIPSVAQLHLILLNINEINKALVEAGGDLMKKNWYWSSTETSSRRGWYVHFGSSNTYDDYKGYTFSVRTAVMCNI